MKRIDSNGSGGDHFLLGGESLINNINHYSNYDRFIIGTSNELIDTKYDKLKILDKVKYGSIGNADLIWTVCEKKDGRVLLCLDYAFNIDDSYYGEIYDEMMNDKMSELFYDLELLNTMFIKDELVHMVQNNSKDRAYGYYFFTLPTSIYNKVLDDESKNVIGTIDLKYNGIGDNSQDISKCSSYDVGIIPKGSYRDIYDVDGTKNKYMRFHLNDRYGESAIAFKCARSEYSIPVRLCIYTNCEEYKKIANYKEHKKIDCVKLCYYLEAEDQKLGPNSNVFPYDEYVKTYTKNYKNYRLFDIDNNDIAKKYKDKTKIYDYNDFIKDY